VSVAAQVQEFIAQEIAPDVGPIAPDLDLLEAAAIDSLGIVRLISFLEERYAIEVDDEDLDPENFRSVDSIVVFVENKQRI
jgi:acyl carrier protein